MTWLQLDAAAMGMARRHAGRGRRAAVTERDRIAAKLRRIGHPDLAERLERYEDRERPAPTIPASEWVKESNLKR
jgi:hypothetical protein